MLKWIEGFLDPTAGTPREPPSEGLGRFYWHFARQAGLPIIALFAAGLAVALLDVTIPLFIGRVVSLVAAHQPKRLFAEAGRELLGMALVLLAARPAALLAQNLVTNQVINPGVSNMIRWQNHWHVVRQSWTFFQNDFAGRIANRVIQTGPALRESIVNGTNAVWYILVYGSTAIALLSASDWRLTIPILCWFAAYGALLRSFVPRMRERSRAVSEARSTLTGRVVDSYTNILTVKLFARAREEDAFVREAVDGHTEAFRRQTRMATGFTFTLAVTNAAMVVGTGLAALLLFREGKIAVGTVATSLPMAWQISNMAGWVAQNITGIFENVGIVQDGMRSIAVRRQMPDPPGARELAVTGGEIRFENLHFDYGRDRRMKVLRGIDFTVAAGERVGLVGPSGAGKSTLIPDFPYGGLTGNHVVGRWPGFLPTASRISPPRAPSPAFPPRRSARSAGARPFRRMIRRGGRISPVRWRTWTSRAVNMALVLVAGGC